MNWIRGLTVRACSLAIVCLAFLASAAWCDTIYLKNGIVYRSQGAPDRDATLLYLWDGLKRTVIYNSKVERIEGDNSFRVGEKFTLSQPLSVHAGVMPKEVLSVQASPWSELGRRSFRYVGARTNRSTSMEQALVEIGPHVTRYRGIDGFWVGQVATSQIPREIISGLLNRVDQKNQDERERVVRFFMNAGWYPEARKGLEALAKDFPKTDLAERAAGARLFMIQAEATARRSEIDTCRRAQQFHRVAELLNGFTDKEISTETQIEIRELNRREQDQRDRDAGLATALRGLEAKLPSGDRETWKKRVAEVVKSIEQAPDAVRGRFVAWNRAKAGAAVPNDKQFALAMSGYVAGTELATDDLALAGTLWAARDLLRHYLAGAPDTERESLVAELEALPWPGDGEAASGMRKLELATRIIQLMPPPLANPAVVPEKPIGHKLEDDRNEAPTDYVVILPPEYHPLRSYPAVLALHSGSGPASAIETWAPEAARHGYIVVAPEYGVPGQSREYGYSPSEHAAAELALRDARKRYAIDGDRVFVAGQLSGGNMAWDLALGHPDLFAGAIVISGFPARYVPRYLPHHERLPLYFVIGDLAPAANEVVYANYIKPMILKVYDTTYVEYHRRGLEEFPEEIPTLFDWMDRHRRDPFPKTFEVVSARTCDDRFYGTVIREFGEGRTTAPEAVEVLGQNLSPARLSMKSSSLSNLINLKIVGIDRRKLDVWLSPKLIDFKRKFEVRINDKPRYKGTAKLTLDAMLEDLRYRGDRQQIYWVKVPAT